MHTLKVKLKKPLVLCFTADEEVGCVGAKHLADENISMARYALIGEPTSLTPVRANKARSFLPASALL